MDRALSLRVDPVDALVDVPRRIRLEGLAPHARVALSARTRRVGGVDWRSAARFRADADGVVDTGVLAPEDGSYSGVSAMGLIWSQSPDDAQASNVFPDDLLEPLETHLTAESDGGRAQAVLIQRVAAAGVSREDVREDGLVGALYRPASPGPHPAIVILNGSGGGMNEPRAALYASHGYVALALAYFKAPGLSDYISNTPLEYFKRGLDWVRATQRPAGGFVALNGQSRGGELVLLLASLFPDDVSAVVAYVPGAVVHGGQNASDPAVGRDGPAWLLDGKPLVHIWNDNRTASWAAFDAGQRHEVSIRTALEDPEAVARARIPVERIRAPIILLSGTDDAAWPSSLYSRMVVDALRAHDFPYDCQWVDAPEGGHAIVFPYIPTTGITHRHPVTGRLFTGGGAPGPNALSNENSWTAIKAFLARAVADHARA
ncbi:acyl-CoA thioester hydrolase/BAAT C-terminal domain-containing protein [uncultured Castellaniella sp.]|mgnify:CR=1 FL=1|uniref:acyl-CoA thioester hydrolase/BAAT C-terminal domain-containing protein n=1 Tax=uncultured Castellaniella sp. TaxID=647907 RepID=UPI00260CCA08|nr:acyl-CoA thioester hydrolase/BAAT C-terminal domain-containing protein [uncultured Castellaniella sp.]